jgi:hypothetical protein
MPGDDEDVYELYVVFVIFTTHEETREAHGTRWNLVSGREEE